MKSSLQSSEWALIGTLLVVMGSLFFIAKVNTYRFFSAISAVDVKQEFLVTIDGAVAKPGEYSVISGSLVEEVLRKARPKPFADIKKLPLRETIEGPLHLTVEELKEITIAVEGAVVEPIQLTLPAKSRISDLKSKVSLTDEADKTYFRKRRWLKDGEVIRIPKL